MDELSEVLPLSRVVLVKKKYRDKLALLRYLLDTIVRAAPELEDHHDDIWATLQERELSMSTGVGLGVAIPHCSSEFVGDVEGLLAVCEHGIDFAAVDEVPVQILVLLLMPKKKFDRHIKILANVARVFNDEGTREAVLAAGTESEVHKAVIRAADAIESG